MNDPAHNPKPQAHGFTYDGRRARFQADGTIDLELDAVRVARALGAASDHVTGCLLDLADHVAAHPDQADDANRALAALTEQHVFDIHTYCDALAASWWPAKIHVPRGCSWRQPWAALPTAAVDRIAAYGQVNAYEHHNLSAKARAEAVGDRFYTVHSNPALTPAEWEELLTAAARAGERDTWVYRLLTNPAITPRAIEAVLASSERALRTLLAINPALNPEQRARGQHDPDGRVRAASCWNPANEPDETAHLVCDPDPFVRGAETDAASWRNRPLSDPAYLWAQDGYPSDGAADIFIPPGVLLDPADAAEEP